MKIKTTKIYCDICGRQIKYLVTQVGFLYMAPKGKKTKIDICGDCVSAIRTMVKNKSVSVVSVKGGRK